MVEANLFKKIFIFSLVYTDIVIQILYREVLRFSRQCFYVFDENRTVNTDEEIGRTELLRVSACPVCPDTFL